MAPNPLHVLRVNARDLLREPGSVKEIEAEIRPADLGVDDDRITSPVSVHLDAVSTLDGVAVTGEVSIEWSSPCRRCLTEVNGATVVEVEELYQDEISDHDAYPIDGDRIDLAPAVREYVVIELPDGPLCRDDCLGICSLCGADRNEQRCDCDATVRDERWAVLDQLKDD